MLANKVEVALSYAISFESFFLPLSPFVSLFSLFHFNERVSTRAYRRSFEYFSDLSLHSTMNPLDLQQQLADQRRGRYVRVSDVDRRLLIDTYKKGEDFIALAT